jgi:hypothetical protein
LPRRSSPLRPRASACEKATPGASSRSADAHTSSRRFRPAWPFLLGRCARCARAGRAVAACDRLRALVRHDLRC